MYRVSYITSLILCPALAHPIRSRFHITEEDHSQGFQCIWLMHGSSPLSMVSLPMVLVTHSQSQSEKNKYPQLTTLSAPDIQPSASSWLHDPE